jgi:hypothetical protein
MKALYHFTCSHAAKSIERERWLRPNRHVSLDHELVWLTDLDRPSIYGLGLTSTILRCDRTEWTVIVPQSDAIVSWGSWAHEHKIGRQMRDELEYGAMPAHWYIAELPVPILAIGRTP